MYFIPHTITCNLSLLLASRQEATFWIGSEQWSVLDVKIKTLNYSFLSLKGMSKCKLPPQKKKKNKLRKQMHLEKPFPSPSPKSKIETLIKPGEGGEELKESPWGLEVGHPLSLLTFQLLCRLSKGTNIGNGGPSQGRLRPK